MVKVNNSTMGRILATDRVDGKDEQTESEPFRVA